MGLIVTNPDISLQANNGSPRIYYFADGAALFGCIGSPEGVITANARSLAITETGAVYVKTTNGVATGWSMISGGGGGGAPVNGQYLVLSLDGTLTAERQLNLQSGLTGTDNGAGNTYDLFVDQTFSPTWTGLHTWNRGTTLGNAITIDAPTNATTGQTKNSHRFSMIGRSNDGAPHLSEFRWDVNMVSPDAQGAALRLQQRVDGGAFSTAFQLEQGGLAYLQGLTPLSGDLISLAGKGFGLTAISGKYFLDVTGNPDAFIRLANLGTPTQPITQANYWREGVTSYTSNTGAITYNPVRWGGWNISGPGTPIETSQPAIWFAWEGSYDPSSVSAYPPSPTNGFPWFEPHLLSYKPAGGSEIRLLTATIQPGTTTPPGSANGYIKFDHRATLWDFQNLESQPVLSLQRGAMGLYGAAGAALTLSDAGGLNFSVQNSASATTMTGLNQLTVTQSGSPTIGQSALAVNSVSNRYNTILNSTSTGAGWHVLTLNNTSNSVSNYASQVFQFAGASVIGMGAFMRSAGNADFYISTVTDAALWIKPDTKTGFLSTAPTRQVEINNATGDNLRLAYNAPNGAATNYVDFQTTSGGNLTVTPSGGLINAVGNLALGLLSVGASATRTLAIGTGAAPTTSPADAAQYYTADAAAGDAQALVRNEAGRIARLTGTVQTLNQTFAKTNTTLANITGSGTDNDLAFNVETGSTYAVRVALQLDAEFAAGGVKVALGGTVTLNTSLTALQVQIYRNDTNVIAASGRISNTASAVSASGAADGSTYFAVIEGSIVVTTGGTITAQFAQAAAAGSSNVLAGSYMEIARQK